MADLLRGELVPGTLVDLIRAFGQQPQVIQRADVLLRLDYEKAGIAVQRLGQ